MSRKRKFALIMMFLVVTAVAGSAWALASNGGTGAMPEHLTVSQAKAGTVGETMKVGGEVMPGTVKWDTASTSLTFTLDGESDAIRVIYRGFAPNDFKPGSPVLAEGTISSEGTFLATTLETTTSPLCQACHG